VAGVSVGMLRTAPKDGNGRARIASQHSGKTTSWDSLHIASSIDPYGWRRRMPVAQQRRRPREIVAPPTLHAPVEMPDLEQEVWWLPAIAGTEAPAECGARGLHAEARAAGAVGVSPHDWTALVTTPCAHENSWRRGSA
jgi:hypothetical protein